MLQLDGLVHMCRLSFSLGKQSFAARKKLKVKRFTSINGRYLSTILTSARIIYASTALCRGSDRSRRASGNIPMSLAALRANSSISSSSEEIVSSSGSPPSSSSRSGSRVIMWAKSRNAWHKILISRACGKYQCTNLSAYMPPIYWSAIESTEQACEEREVVSDYGVRREF